MSKPQITVRSDDSAKSNQYIDFAQGAVTGLTFTRLDANEKTSPGMVIQSIRTTSVGFSGKLATDEA